MELNVCQPSVVEIYGALAGEKFSKILPGSTGFKLAEIFERTFPLDSDLFRNKCPAQKDLKYK